MTEKTNDYCGRASGRSSATKQREKQMKLKNFIRDH